jgi:hypothetical protein
MTGVVERVVVDQVGRRRANRRRTRTPAFVAAVCAMAALTLAINVWMAAVRAETAAPIVRPNEVRIDAYRVGGPANRARRVPVPDEILRRVSAGLPDAEMLRLTIAEPAAPANYLIELADRFTADDGTGGPLATSAATGRFVIADDVARSVFPLTDHARQQLHAVGMLATGAQRGRSVGAVMGRSPSADRTPRPVETFRLAVVTAEDAPGLDVTLVTPGRARDLGLIRLPGTVVVRVPRPLDDEQRAMIESLRAAPPWWVAGMDGLVVHLDAGEPPVTLRSALIEGGLTAGTLVITLLIVVAGLGVVGAGSRRRP